MRTALAVILVVSMASATSAQVSIGGAQSLCIQPTARSAGMADCTMAVLDDASAASWNPGGLAFMEGDLNASGMFSRLVPDWEDVYYWYGAAAVRIMPEMTVAASLTYLSYGKQVATDPDSPEPIGTFESYERIPSLACAVSFMDHIGVGLNVKYVYVNLAPASFTQDQQNGEGSTIGADLGVEYRAGVDLGRLELLLRGAGAVRNLGGKVEYIDEEQADKLPICASVGGSAQLSYGCAGHVLACGQYQRSLVNGWDPDQSGIWGVGMEAELSLLGLTSRIDGRTDVSLRDIFSGRLGYYDDDEDQVKGMSYGFGAGVEMYGTAQFKVDFANVPQTEGLTRPWRIGGSGWVAF